MEASFEFTVNGPNMEFAMYLLGNGHTVPAGLFIEILTEKCQLINKHLHRVTDHLVIMASVTNTIPSIKIHDINLEEDSQLLHVILSNLPDLEDQLIHLWMEVRSLLRYYHIDDHATELASIDMFYHDLAYEELLQANFML